MVDCVTAKQNAPARIDSDLTRSILRGDYPPGTRLPPLRDLAGDYGVNPSTMQRALARIEARGLVTARQGSGLRVNDPDEIGDMSLFPDWLAATLDDPERAMAILEDLLEVRRVLAVRLILRHRESVLEVIDDLATEVAGAGDLAEDQFWIADFAFARRLLRATGNSVALAILNSLARAMKELPELVAAMYEDPKRNVASMMTVLAAIRAGGDDLTDRIERAMAEIDGLTVAAFGRLLAQRGARS